MLIKIKQNLSKSIICSWKITKNPEPKNNYNIISVVFFKKYEYYRDISEYINGLRNIIKNFSKILPSFRLRIYHDFSALEIITNLLKESKYIDNIELYEYDIDFFREEKDKTYHKGTIGTIIRFLPLFNLEHHKVDKCLILDIDNVLRISIVNIIKLMDDNNVKIGYRSRFCYSAEHISCVNDNNIIKYPLIASLIYQTISVPYNILSDFFEDIYINKNLELIKKCKLINEYEYGIDELFMNEKYLKYFYQNKLKISPILFNHVNILIGMINYFDNINDNSSKLYLSFIYDFFKLINFKLNTMNQEKLKEYMENNSNLIDKYINNIFYNKFLKNKIIKFIYNMKHLSKKLYKFDLLLNCILNNIKYINVKMINMLLLSTDYNKQANVTNIEHKMISWN